MESQGSPQSIWTIILSIVLTAVVVGGGLYFWQKAQTDALRQEIQDLKTQNEELSKVKEILAETKTDTATSEPVSTKTETKVDTAYQTSALCTAASTSTDIGRDVYPIDPKYDGLGFLG